MKYLSLRLAAGLAMLGWVFCAWAQSPPAAERSYLHDSWQLEDGLPQITVWALAQDSRGYLWLGTEEGLVRFDGLRFEVFGRRDKPELGNVVQALAADSRDGLWIGTRRGLLLYRGGRFIDFSAVEGPGNEEVNVLHVDSENHLWIGTAAGLWRFDGEAFTAYTTGDDLGPEAVLAIAGDRQGNLWIGTESGLLRFDGEGFYPVADDHLADQRIDTLLEDRDGRLWVGTATGLQMSPSSTSAESAASTPERSFSVPPAVSDLAGTPIYTLYQDRHGNLWIGNKDGLARLVEGKLTRYGSPEVLSDPHVVSLLEDREANLWIGTRYGGLSRFRERRLTAFGKAEGLIHDLVWSIYQDRAGNIWIATDGGLDRLAPDGTLTHFTTDDGLPARDVGALYEDRRGDLWVGTFGDGLVRFRNGAFHTYSVADGFPPASVRCFAEDRDGALWAGTDSGLVRLEGDELRVFTTADGLPHDAVRGLHVDGSGTLWIVTQDGVARHESVATPAFRDLGSPFSGRLKTLYGEDDGTLWIGTWEDGLARFRNGAFSTFTVTDGLFDHRIHQILDDGQGSFWMPSNRGIFRIERQQLEDFAAGRITSLAPVAYDESDGMRSRECNGATQSSGVRTRQGELWFPTIRGVAIVKPDILTDVPATPAVVIEEMQVDHNPIQLSSRVELGPRPREIHFLYAAPSFVKPDKIHFRYRLEGFDGDWVDAGTRRSVQYTNLPPGNYRFRVVARGSDGVWNQSGTSLELYVRPAFYQTWYFYLAGALLALLAGRAVYNLRVSHLLRLHKIRSLEEKQAELEFLTKTVSHDLRSPLTTIRGFMGLLKTALERGQESKADLYFQRMEQAAAHMGLLLDELLDYSRAGQQVYPSGAVSLGEIAKEAAELVEGQLAERGAQVVIADDLLNVVGDPARLLRVFQNLIENSVKFMGEQSEPRIEIGAYSEGRETTCYVRDNGIGIDSQHLARIFGLFHQLDREIDGTGIGLPLVQRIIEAHGGRIWAESGGIGQGSTFYFTLPRHMKAA